ncbi:MAG: interleukin-like EMT inducer domain-containing protein [Anaerolineae bacterium]
MHRTIRRQHLLVLAAYALLALLLTYPVVLAPGRLVPGSDTWAYDEYTFLWNIWWLKHAALDLGVNPLYTAYTFYPVGAPLVLYTYALLNCALALPLYLATSLPLASNLVLWASLVLSGYTTYSLTRYLLVRRLSRSDGPAVHLAAFLGGVAYAFTASRFVYLAIGHYCIATVATLPLFAIYLLRTLDAGATAPGVSRPRRWWPYAVLAGVCFTLSAYTEMTFALFLALFALVIVVFERRLGLARLAARLGVAAAAALVTYAPLLYYVLRESLVGSYALRGWGDSVRLSADLAGLVMPTALHPVWGSDWVGELQSVAAGVARFSDVNTFFLGYVLLALAVVGAIAFWRRAAPWLAAGLVAIVFSLGPLLHVNGHTLFDLDGLQTTLPLPFVLLHYVPILNAGRTPNRFSVMALLALAPVAGMGAYWLLSRARRWWLLGPVAAVIAVGLVWDGLSVPLPTTDAAVPAFYQTLAEDDEDYAILVLPFGLRTSFGTAGAEQTQLQYYQTVHGKRILGGNVSRAPTILFDYYTRIAPLARLLAVEAYGTVDLAELPALRQQAAALASLLDIRYLVVQAPVPGRLPYADTYDEAIPLALSLFDASEVFRAEDGSLIAYEIRHDAPAADLTIDLGSDDSAMYTGEGWSVGQEIGGAPAQWVDGDTAILYLPGAGTSSHALTFRAAPFTYAGSSQQSVTVAVNGHPIADLALSAGWQEYSVRVPAEALRAGTNTVALRFAYARRPADVVPDSYAIGATGLPAPTHLEVHSTRDLAYITVGEADGSKHADGLNVALFDRSDGALLAADVFGWSDAGRLARFLGDVPGGSGVLVAVQGGVPDSVDGATCAALQSVGAPGCPAGGGGFALIGATGAQAGSALVAEGDDAYLVISPDDRRLSAAVDWLRWQSQP